MNQLLGEKNRKLSDYLMEIQAFRGTVSVCSSCKSIRDDAGQWQPIERYMIRHPEATFTHGLCPHCLKKLYPDFDEDEEDWEWCKEGCLGMQFVSMRGEVSGSDLGRHPAKPGIIVSHSASFPNTAETRNPSNAQRVFFNAIGSPSG
jgi:hypothetical protein